MERSRLLLIFCHFLVCCVVIHSTRQFQPSISTTRSLKLKPFPDLFKLSSTSQKLFAFRGGSFTDSHIVDVLASSKPVEDEDVNEDEDNDEQEDRHQAPGGIMNLESVPFLRSLVDLWKKTPPMTQVYLSSTMMITVLSAMFNQNRWPGILKFDWKSILLEFQLWRLFTAFLYFGPLDMFYPLTLQFVWQHMSQLEKMDFKAPEEFLLLALFGAASLIGVYSLLGVSMNFLGHNFATYLVYIWSRKFEGTDVNFMDIITLKSEFIPWFFCLQTMILEKEVPFADLIGIAVGHLYYYLKLKKLLVVPTTIAKLFSSDFVKKKYESFRADFE